MFRSIFIEMNKENWSRNCVNDFNHQLKKNVFEVDEIGGLIMHVADIFLEELAKVAKENISGDSVAELIKPFITYLAEQHDFKLMEYIKNRIFYHWLWQSDRGREYNEKFDAWKQMGFPTESINEIEKVEEEPEEGDANETENTEKLSEKDKIFDPRAGNVDVFVPQLEVNVTPIIELIEAIQFKEITNTKSRKILRIILEKYKAYKSGEFPLGIKKMPKPELEPMKPLVEKKVDDLEKFENELYSTTRNLKKLSKKKRRRLLASINYDDVDEENFEEVLNAVIPGNKKRPHINDDWMEEDIEASSTKKSKIENSNIKKNKDKSKKKTKENVLNETSNYDNSNEWLESVPDPNPVTSLTDKVTSKENINTETKETSLTNNTTISEWDKPLQEGEIEYFVSSRKTKLKEANEDFSSQNLVLNPFAKKNKKKLKNEKNVLLGKSAQISKKLNGKQLNQFLNSTLKKKKVKIVLHKNMAQKPSDYIQQVKSSPQLPHDPEKQPRKSLLKPNLLPSPINPFYQKKIGLKLDKTF